MKRQTQIGKNIFRLCKTKGIGLSIESISGEPTVYGIAQGAGLPDSTLREIVYGPNSPTMETLRILAKYFDLKVGELLVELTK